MKLQTAAVGHFVAAAACDELLCCTVTLTGEEGTTTGVTLLQRRGTMTNSVMACAGEQLSGSCAAGACSKPHWRAAAWSRCNATCGGGVITRTLTCIGGDGAAAADPTAVCRDVPSPAASAPCNIAPCVGYTWQVHLYACLISWFVAVPSTCTLPVAR